MKYFFDTEFVETVGHIELISIGIVAEDGREYYAVNRNADLSKADSWVTANVLDKMAEFDDFSQTFCNQTNSLKPLSTIKEDILEFTGQNKEEAERCNFYAYYCAYDWVVFCWIFGRMIDLPKGYPMYCRDLKQMLDEASVKVPYSYDEELGLKSLKLSENYPKQDNEHDALDDAKWNKELYKFIKSL